MSILLLISSCVVAFLQRSCGVCISWKKTCTCNDFSGASWKQTDEEPRHFAIPVNNFGVKPANCIATCALQSSADQWWRGRCSNECWPSDKSAQSGSQSKTIQEIKRSRDQTIKVNKQDFLQVFQVSGIGKIEDNLRSANPLSYTTTILILGRPGKRLRIK